MTRRPRNDVARELQRLRAPDEHGAEDRAWAVVRSVYSERTTTRPRWKLWRLAFAPVGLLVVGVLALTPAGAAVRRWIDLSLGVPHASQAIFALPAAGNLLVSGPTGAWTVSVDGARRHLGPWPQASWSPHAIYVAVARGSQLAAIDTRGSARWTLARPGVRFPRWFPPSGYRVAYLSTGSLRIVAGDGTGDRLLARHVALVAPAWRPDHPYELAYSVSPGTIVVRDADGGRVQWSRQLSSPPRRLAWSADGGRLVVLSRDAVVVLDGRGRALTRVALDPAHPALDAALSPDGHTLALSTSSDLTLTDLPPLAEAPRRVFTGDGLRQLAWSPDGHWLLVSWPAADQWIFVRATGAPRIAAVSRIAEQFSPGAASHQFPQLDGWCCTSTGGAG